MSSDTAAPEYIEDSESGFRHRLLDVDPEAGYPTIAVQLLPDELLYRMMDGPYSVGGKPFPILIEDEISFQESINRWGHYGFKLAAGIPNLTHSKPKQKSKD